MTKTWCLAIRRHPTSAPRPAPRQKRGRAGVGEARAFSYIINYPLVNFPKYELFEHSSSVSVLLLNLKNSLLYKYFYADY